MVIPRSAVSGLPDVDLASAFNIMIMIVTSSFHGDSEVCRVGPWNGILPRPPYGGTAVAAVPEMKCSPDLPGVMWLRSSGRNLSHLYRPSGRPWVGLRLSISPSLGNRGSPPFSWSGHPLVGTPRLALRVLCGPLWPPRRLAPSLRGRWPESAT